MSNSAFSSIGASGYSGYSGSSSSGPSVYSYTKRLTQTDIVSNLPSGSVTVSSADLGLTGTQSAKFHPLATEWYIVTDGTPFTGSDYIVLKSNVGASAAFYINTGEFVGGGDTELVGYTLPTPVSSGSVLRILPGMGYYMQSGGVLGGGGVNAYIDVKMYYEKIDF